MVWVRWDYERHQRTHTINEDAAGSTPERR